MARTNYDSMTTEELVKLRDSLRKDLDAASEYYREQRIQEKLNQVLGILAKQGVSD